MNIDWQIKNPQQIDGSTTILTDDNNNTVPHRNYLIVFMIVGVVTLIPLIFITAIVLRRSVMPKQCRITLVIVCLALASSVAAIVFIYFVLGSQQYTFIQGDQLLFGESNHGYVIGFDELRSLVCNQLEFVSDQLGVRVWSSPVSPNYGPRQNYSLVINNWPIPSLWQLRLNNGDRLVGLNFTQPVRIILLRGMGSVHKWWKSGKYKLGYEKCCAWKIIDSVQDRSEIINIDYKDLYTIILRPANYSSTTINNNGTRVSGFINMNRTRWIPNPCDSTLCDGSNKLCRINSAPKSYIVDYTIGSMTAPNIKYAKLHIVCHPRHWLLGLLFTAPSVIILTMMAIIWFCSNKRKSKSELTNEEINDKINKLTNRLGTYKHESVVNENPSFEFDWL